MGQIESYRPVAIRSLLAAAASGVLLGIAARVVMRLVARESGLEGGFTLGGSLEVVAFGALIGAPIALLFFMFRHRVSVPAPWAGLLCGFALFLVFLVFPPPAAQSALVDTPDTPASTAVAFAVLFVGWGAMLEYVGRRLLWKTGI